MESESISQEFQISERKQRKGNKGEERSRGGHTDLGASAEGGERRRGGAAAAPPAGRSSSGGAGGEEQQWRRRRGGARAASEPLSPYPSPARGLFPRLRARSCPRCQSFPRGALISRALALDGRLARLRAA